MDRHLPFQEKTYSFFARFIIVITLLVAVYNCVAGLVFTMTFHVETAPFNAQGFIHKDPIGMNLLLLLSGIVLLTLLSGVRPSKRGVRLVAAAVLAGTAAWGIAWVLSVRSLPYADGYDIMLTLQDVIAGKNPAGNTIYFQKYPFQAGYALYEESLLRLFGPEHLFAVPAINVLFAVLAETGILHIAEALFSDTRITFLTTILMMLCTQPILFCTHFYGNMPGLMLAMWGSYAVICYFQNRRIRFLAAAVVLIPCAILLKNNYYLCLIASAILLLLFGMRNRSWSPVIGTALMVCLSIALTKGAWWLFAEKIGVEPGEGTPLTAYLVMGGNETNGANPGWYDMYTYYIYEDNEGEPGRMRTQIRADLSRQLAQWKENPAERLLFYVRKLITQWNEPTYQSIWISQVSYRDTELNAFENSLLFGRGRILYEKYCNQYVQIVYALFAGGLCVLLLKRSLSPELLLLPLWIFGAFLYHCFFEAQSQYAVMYLPMMLPYAASAAVSLRDGLRGKVTDTSE